MTLAVITGLVAFGGTYAVLSAAHKSNTVSSQNGSDSPAPPSSQLKRGDDEPTVHPALTRASLGEAAIREAYNVALGGQAKDAEEASTAVEDGVALRAVIARLRERSGPLLPQLSVEVKDMSLNEGSSTASLQYRLLLDGNEMLRWRKGTGIVVDGYWVVARSTMCELAHLGGEECPGSAMTTSRT